MAWQTVTLATGTIASGQSLSDAIDLQGYTPLSVLMPGTWTAATLTFQLSADGGTTFVEVCDGYGSAVNPAAAALQSIALDPAVFAAATHLKIRSGTSASAVNQAADRALILSMRPVA